MELSWNILRFFSNIYILNTATYKTIGPKVTKFVVPRGSKGICPDLGTLPD